MKHIHIFFTVMALVSIYVHVSPQISYANEWQDSGSVYFKTESPTDEIGKKDLTRPIKIQKEDGFSGFVDNFVVRIGQIAVRVLIALSLFMFLWGLMKYMYKGQESDTARADGRKLMLWGIIGLFVMTGVWGLVSILSGILGVDTIGTPQFKVKQ